MQKEEYLIKNACYSVTKYYLCKRNNKRSLSGRKQRLEVVRSFPNRYQFSCINKVTSLFSNRYIFIIILSCEMTHFIRQQTSFHNTIWTILFLKTRKWGNKTTKITTSFTLNCDFFTMKWANQETFMNPSFLFGDSPTPYFSANKLYISTPHLPSH